MDQRKLTKTEEVIRKLCQRIDERYYGAGTRLPAERDLAVELEISRQTIRLVLQRLQVLGLVAIVPNIGTYVRSPLHRVEIGPPHPLGGAPSPRGGAKAEILTHSFECPSVVQADVELAQTIGVEIGSELARRALLSLIDQRPVRFMEWYVPQALLTQNTGLLQWLCGQDAYLGHWLAGAPSRSDPSAFERFVCRLPTPHEAHQLAISRSQPVIEIERWIWLTPHTLGVYTRMLANAAQHTFTYAYHSTQWPDLVNKISGRSIASATPRSTP